MPAASVQPAKLAPPDQGDALLAELESAYDTLVVCMDELQQLLEQPHPNLVQLTMMRLRLAHLRISRGLLVEKVFSFLAGKITSSERALLEEFRSAHQCLLEKAVAHTGKWSLDAIEEDWEGYRRATREVTRKWLEKAKNDQNLLYPLLRRNS